MSEPKIGTDDRVFIPFTHLPGFRTTIAIQNGVEKNLLFRTWGGLGDQICAEPTLRYALKSFKGCDLSLASEAPELFSHLNFKRVFDLKEEIPIYSKYFLFDTIVPNNDTNLVWQFMSHMLTNCVDFPSLCALRLQLPTEDREVIMDPRRGYPVSHLDMFLKPNFVHVHAGKHWPSKTFPKDWWDAVLADLIARRITPVLIGADTYDNRSTVDVNTTGTIDLRNKLSISESIWIMQRCRVLLTNDSSPLHMAASRPERDGPPKSEAPWIGYIATCKHPDHITHWRHGEWGYRMQNHGSGGVWDLVDYCPNRAQEITAEFVSEEQLRAWLPAPSDYAAWALSKLS